MGFPKMKWMAVITMILGIVAIGEALRRAVVSNEIGMGVSVISLIVIAGAILIVVIAAGKLRKGERMYIKRNTSAK